MPTVLSRFTTPATVSLLILLSLGALRRRTRSATGTIAPVYSPEDLSATAKHFTHASADATSLDAARRVAVNKAFFRQLSSIFHILIPSLRSKEAGIIALHSVFLILRTWMSVIVAKLDGRIVRDLVAADRKAFLRGLVWWFAMAIPATYTNSMIRYLQSKLSITFRTRLTRYAHDLYMDAASHPYYAVPTLDRRVDHLDQYITTDIAKFCEVLASLFSNVGKPVLDILIFNYQLAVNVGMTGTIALAVNYAFTASLIRAATPAFGRLAAQEAKLEGDLRAAHSRLITNAEEIAFYHGADRELGILRQLYEKLAEHLAHVQHLRIGYTMFEDFVLKYCWSAVGLLVSAVPVFRPDLAGTEMKRWEQERAANTSQKQEELRTGDNTRGFITNKRLMVSLADAGGRVLYSYKELAELAGRTLRVYNLLAVLHAVRNGEPALLRIPDALGEMQMAPKGHVSDGYDGVRFDGVPVVVPGAEGKLHETSSESSSISSLNDSDSEASSTNVRGGEMLVRKMHWRVLPGDHLLITGANGVGKTGVARLIAGLWPVYDGTLSRPKSQDIFYIPQRPYLCVGSLRDQVIYPHSHDEMLAAGRTDADLKAILDIVRLGYLPAREAGWDTVKEWKDVFSGGEKQRINLARLFYHRPKFAVLDECTSAVSNDVEGFMYSHAKEMGITLITISHRPALYKYHEYLLRMGTGRDGHGWDYIRIGDDAEEERMGLEKELTALEKKLFGLEKARARLAEIDRELSMVDTQ